MGCYCVYKDHQLFAPGVKIPPRQDAEAAGSSSTAGNRKEIPITRKEAALRLREFRGDVQLRTLYSLTPVLMGSLVVAEGIESRKKFFVHILKKLGRGTETKELVEKLRSLNHPNILRVNDVVKDLGTVCLVYENCAGLSAMEMIKQSGPTSDILSLCIIKQVFAAIRHCHSADFLLRNLCLSHVLFLEPPSSANVHIKVLPYDDRKTETTAPEATEPASALPASDIYSAGLILAQMLLGDTNPQSALSRCLRNSTRDWGHIPVEAKKFVFSLISPDATNRPSIHECFRHSWVASWQNPSSEIAESAAVNAVRSVASGKPMPQLKQALLLFLFNQTYPEEQMKEVQLAFRMLDVDMDGEVSGSEILSLLLKHYSKPTARSYFSAILEATGIPASGSISFSEFLIRGCNRSLLVSHVVLTPIFHMLDREHRGRVSLDRLKEVVRIDEEMDADREKTVWTRALAEVTSAPEGISFNDFCVYLRGAKATST